MTQSGARIPVLDPQRGRSVVKFSADLVQDLTRVQAAGHRLDLGQGDAGDQGLDHGDEAHPGLVHGLVGEPNQNLEIVLRNTIRGLGRNPAGEVILNLDLASEVNQSLATGLKRVVLSLNLRL